MDHYSVLNHYLNKIKYRVKSFWVYLGSKELQVCLYKRFGTPSEGEVRRHLEGLGYTVLMMDGVTVPGEITVQCCYN